MSAGWVASPRCISEHTANGHQLIASAPYGKGGTVEWAENARLMAGSRDLLAAAQSVLRSFAYAPGAGPEWYEATRLAFEKAGGWK